MTQPLAPVVLFVFNRPEHTRRTVESLRMNRLATQSDLFVFADGPRGAKDDADVRAVRGVIRAIQGFKSVTIRERSANRGLAESVIGGVSEVMRSHGRVIVVEDDLLFSPYFLAYMNEALMCYEGDRRIFSVGGYSPPLAIPSDYTRDSYLSYRCCTWGWGTWRDRWASVDWDVKDFDAFSRDIEMIRQFNRGGEDMFQILKLQREGKVSSWGIRWDYAHFRNSAYCFRPVRSIVANTGNDGSGVHCQPTDKFDVNINSQPRFTFPEPGRLEVSEELNRRFATFYDGKPRGGMPASAVPSNASFFRKLVAWGRRLPLR